MLWVWVSAKLHTRPWHTSYVQNIPETPTILYEMEPKPFSQAFGVGHSATFRLSSMALLLYIRQSMPTSHRWPSHELCIHSCCFSWIPSSAWGTYLYSPPQTNTTVRWWINFEARIFTIQFQSPYFHTFFPSPVAFNLPSSVFSYFIPVTEFIVPGLTLWLWHMCAFPDFDQPGVLLWSKNKWINKWTK